MAYLVDENACGSVEGQVAYNLDDCAALRKVVDTIQEVSAGHVATLSTDAEDPLLVSRVEELERLTNPRKWSSGRFVNPDYKFVNDRSYFDYQRHRVFVRTSKRLKKQARTRRSQQNRRLRARSVEIEAIKCINCGSGNISRIEPLDRRRKRAKRSFDLRLSGGAISRQVIDYRATLYSCVSCGAEFRPRQYEQVSKYRHGLMSWAISLHIAQGLGSGTIGEMLYEFFGIAIPRQEIHVFKSIFARRYRSVYRKLTRKLTTGAILHADETEFRLRFGKSYVWVFANLEEVVFVRRPNREGAFLRELLGDFGGVLITDFYAAYDGLECRQQKCLIHLIRDINEALLDAPYDGELQEIARRFGSLLRRIVSSVDDHGLKRKHLLTHRTEVHSLFGALAAATYRSEPAQALQKRLIKFQDKLFAFISEDGVPWNNSVAENAIKHLARYRAGTSGLMTEAGLDDYLILLSLYVTCRNKGVSFLKFLLSRSRDIDAFVARPAIRPRSTAIEQYPPGFDFARTAALTEGNRPIVCKGQVRSLQNPS